MACRFRLALVDDSPPLTFSHREQLFFSTEKIFHVCRLLLSNFPFIFIAKQFLPCDIAARSLRRLNKYTMREKRSTKEMNSSIPSSSRNVSLCALNRVHKIHWLLSADTKPSQVQRWNILFGALLSCSHTVLCCSVPIKFPLNFRWKMRNLLPDFSLYVYKTFPLTFISCLCEKGRRAGRRFKKKVFLLN